MLRDGRACLLLSLGSVDLWHDRMRALQASQGKARAGMTYAGDLVQLVAQESFIAGRALDCDLDEVIVLARRKVHFQDLGQFSHGAAEGLEDEIVMPVERNLDQDGFRYTEACLVEQRGIALDIALGLQPTDALPAGTGGQSYPIRELGVAQARICKKLP